MDADFVAPAPRLYRAWHQALFGHNHPFASRLSPSDLRSVPSRALLEWIATVRTPDNAVLVIVGDLDSERTLAQVEEAFGGWSRRGANLPAVAEPTPVAQAASGAGGRLLVQNWPNATHAEVTLACILPPGEQAGRARRELVAWWLATQLEDDFRRHEGASYGVSTELNELRGGIAYLQSTADVSYERLDAVLSRLQSFVAGAADAVLTERAFERAPLRAAGAYNLRLASTLKRAELLANEWLLAGSLGALREYPVAIANTALSEAQEVAEHCRRNSVVALLGDTRRLDPKWVQPSRGGDGSMVLVGEWRRD